MKPNDAIPTISEQELSIMVNYEMRDVILDIKRVVEENHFSPPDVRRLLEEQGEFLGLSTIRRVLDEGSEDRNFHFNSTILPLKNVLLDNLNITEDPATTLLRLENLERICEKQEELIDALREQMKQLNRICAQYEETMTLCKEQIAVKDKRMDLKDSIIADLMKKNDDLIAQVQHRSK